MCMAVVQALCLDTAVHQQTKKPIKPLIQQPLKLRIRVPTTRARARRALHIPLPRLHPPLHHPVRVHDRLVQLVFDPVRAGAPEEGLGLRGVFVVVAREPLHYFHGFFFVQQAARCGAAFYGVVNYL